MQPNSPERLAYQQVQGSGQRDHRLQHAQRDRMYTDRSQPTLDSRTAQLFAGVAGPAGMAVSLARSVERSRQAWLSYPLPARYRAWLSNDVPACRGLAVAWLKRGARAPL